MNISFPSIDNIAFAKKGERLNGEVSLSACQRLMDLLQSQVTANADADGSSVIYFSLAGEVDAQGRCFLNVKISATLKTSCQRCLEPMSLPFELNFRYLIAEGLDEIAEDASADDSDEYDLQAPDAAMDVVALIEDELIMAMPIAPVHDSDCAKLTMQAGDKPNPFAALKGLIKS